MAAPAPLGFRPVVRFVWSYFADKPVSICVVIVLSVLRTILSLAVPYLLSDLVLRVSGPTSPAAYEAGMRSILLVVACGMLSWCLQLAKHTVYDYYVKIPAMEAAAVRAFARVQRFPAQWHADGFSGATVRKITRGMYAVQSFVDTFYDSFIPLALTFVGIAVGFGMRWPVMGALVIVGSILYTIISARIGERHIVPANEAYVEADSRVGAELSDALSCNASVKSFAREGDEDGRFREAAAGWRKALFDVYYRYNVTDAAQGIVLHLLQASVFLLALWLWRSGQAVAADVVFVITTYGILSEKIYGIGEKIRSLRQATVDLSDIARFAVEPLERPDGENAPDLAVSRGAVRFESVTFGYSRTDPLYRDLSADIAAGTRVALVGKSGSGKTTFVKLLQGLYVPNGGRVLIDGQDIATRSLASLRRAVSLVPQDPALFHRSLAENIAYGRPDATRAQIVEAATLAHAHEFIARLPDGYDTPVGERGVKLSGGERQRVAIARAILADAPILVMDEATSSLDSISERLIQDALHALTRGRTSIIVAHRLSTIRSADRILVFSGGKIVESGTFRELLASEGYFYELWKTQELVEDAHAPSVDNPA